MAPFIRVVDKRHYWLTDTMANLIVVELSHIPRIKAQIEWQHRTFDRVTRFEPVKVLFFSHRHVRIEGVEKYGER